MAEKPILFSRSMVQAILAGRKTQTRRVVTPQPRTDLQWGGWLLDTTGDQKHIGCACWNNDRDGISTDNQYVRCPYGQPGDRLWVRETFASAPNGFVYKASFPDDGFGSQVVDMGTGEMIPLIWKPSIHMPRAACRITLDVVSVRVERLQAITRDDAKAEGTSSIWRWDASRKPELHRRGLLNPYIANYSVLWDEINAGRGFGWDTNPWVWVVEFKVVTAE